MNQWTLPIIGFALGLLFWGITYIGAPLESKKRGRYVSGVPGVAFVCFLIAGLLSPIKWLAFLCLLDISITFLPFYLLKRYIKKKKQLEGTEEDSVHKM